MSTRVTWIDLSDNEREVGWIEVDSDRNLTWEFDSSNPLYPTAKKVVHRYKTDRITVYGRSSATSVEDEDGNTIHVDDIEPPPSQYVIDRLYPMISSENDDEYAHLYPVKEYNV